MRLLKSTLNDLHHVNAELYKSSGNNYYEGVADGYDMALQQVEAYEKRLKCGCQSCVPNEYPNMRMVLCGKCGDKRCPRAKDHNNLCDKENLSTSPDR